MKTSQMYFIICNMFLIGSFVSRSILGSIGCMIISLLWAFSYVRASNQELKIMILEDLYEKKKLEMMRSLAREIYGGKKK